MKTIRLLLLTAAVCAISSASFGTTYKGDYFQIGHITVTDPNMSEVILLDDNLPYTGHALPIRLTYTLDYGTFSGCVTQPSISVTTFANGLMPLTIASGQTTGSRTFTQAIINDNFTLRFKGGVGCPPLVNPVEVHSVLEYQLETGYTDHYFEESFWQVSAPGSGVQWLNTTFDPEPSGHPYYPQRTYEVLAYGTSFQNCNPIATIKYSSGSQFYQDFLPNNVNEQFAGVGMTTINANTSLVHILQFGSGCDQTPTGYNEATIYDTDSSDVGPYYFSALVAPPSTVTSSTTIEVVTSSTQKAFTVHAIRASVNGGQRPSGCTVWPSIGLQVGSTTQKVTFSSSTNDPTWTGNFSVPAGSTVKWIFNPGSGCSGNIQATALAEYSIS